MPRLAKDYCAVTVQKDSVLDVPLYGAREHGTLHIPAHTSTGFDAHGVINTCDVLLDDRPLIQIRCHIVGRGTDELHTSIVCLLVRLRTLEARQERVMYVDCAPGKLSTYARRQNLHV